MSVKYTDEGTIVLPITYEEVKEYSETLLSLLDVLAEVRRNEEL